MKWCERNWRWSNKNRRGRKVEDAAVEFEEGRALTHLIDVTEEAQADLQLACPSGRREVVQLDLGKVIAGRVRC
jgi:hypothetical protein